MHTDPDECLVYCDNCNAYLHAISRYDPQSRGASAIAIKCPYKCERQPDGTVSMEISPNCQPYGRS